MTTTMTLTPRPEIGAVTIEVTDAPAGSLTISRSDINGPGIVRLLDGQEPISGAMVATDYEVALHGEATYTIVGDAGLVTETIEMAVAQPAIGAAVLPSTVRFVTAVTDLGDGRTNQGSVHRIINREDPIVVTTVMTSREGPLVAVTDSYEDAKALDDTLKRGEVLMFRQPTFEGMDKYLMVLRSNVVPSSSNTATRRWEVRIDYVEVRSPSGPLLDAAGWDYDAVAAAYPTYADMALDFANYNALAVGP